MLLVGGKDILSHQRLYPDDALAGHVHVAHAADLQRLYAAAGVSVLHEPIGLASAGRHRKGIEAAAIEAQDLPYRTRRVLAVVPLAADDEFHKGIAGVEVGKGERIGIAEIVECDLRAGRAHLQREHRVGNGVAQFVRLAIAVKVVALRRILRPDGQGSECQQQAQKQTDRSSQHGVTSPLKPRHPITERRSAASAYLFT